MAALVEQEFDSARIRVVDLARECDCVGTHRGPQFLGQVRRGRQLDDLLMAALQAAVALEKVHDVAVPVGQDLHLDVTRVEHRLLEIHRRVSERRLRLAAGRLDRLRQCGGIRYPPHPAATTAGHRLDEQRELHARRRRDQFIDRGRRRRRRQHGQTGRPCGRDRACLVTRQLEHVGAGADERDTGFGTRGRQIWVLRKESVSGVDRIATRLLGDPDDLVDREIRADRMTRLADLVRLVGLQPVLGVAILVRVHRDGRDAHLVGGAKRADRDLAAIGHQDFGNHQRTLSPTPGAPTRSGSTSNSRTAPGSSGSAR